jgi:hypothetical protein
MFTLWNLPLEGSLWPGNEGSEPACKPFLSILCNLLTIRGAICRIRQLVSVFVNRDPRFCHLLNEPQSRLSTQRIRNTKYP